MKNLNDIKNQYTNNANQIEKLKSLIDEEHKKPFKEYNVNTLNGLCKEKEFLNRENKILRNNYTYLFFENRIENIIEVLNKYTGKKIGEKTLEKINTELSEINIRVYIAPSEIHIYSKDTFITYDYNDIYFWTKHKKEGGKYQFFDDKFKFIGLNDSIEYDLYKSYRDYIPNIPGFIDSIMFMHDNIIEKSKELEKMIDGYNKAIGKLNGFKYKDRPNTVYSYID